MNLNRFKQLLESSLGNVKPLICEGLGYYMCNNSDCSVGQSSGKFPMAMDCPVCHNPMVQEEEEVVSPTIGQRIKNRLSKPKPDFNTVEGRIESLDSYFSQYGNGEDYYKMRDINNHFQNGGTIEDLPSDHYEGEISLNNIYRNHYKSFTADEFSEIFRGLKKTKEEEEDNY